MYPLEVKDPAPRGWCRRIMNSRQAWTTSPDPVSTKVKQKLKKKKNLKETWQNFKMVDFAHPDWEPQSLILCTTFIHSWSVCISALLLASRREWKHQVCVLYKSIVILKIKYPYNLMIMKTHATVLSVKMYMYCEASKRKDFFWKRKGMWDAGRGSQYRKNICWKVEVIWCILPALKFPANAFPVPSSSPPSHIRSGAQSLLFSAHKCVVLSLACLKTVCRSQGWWLSPVIPPLRKLSRRITASLGAVWAT